MIWGREVLRWKCRTDVQLEKLAQSCIRMERHEMGWETSYCEAMAMYQYCIQRTYPGKTKSPFESSSTFPPDTCCPWKF